LVVDAGQRVQFDNETWASLDLLAKDQMKSFPELADEAFRDLLRKHGRPVDLKDALRRSAGKTATVYQLQPAKKKSLKKRASTRRRAYILAALPSSCLACETLQAMWL
jgi:hypothetical protein